MEALQRLPDETALAWQYFKLYCEMPATERSLRVLCQRDVNGKKRSLKVLGRWSSQHSWQARAAAFDAQTQRAAADALLARRQAEIEDFIEKDVRVSQQFQEVCIRRLTEISESDTVNALELRQLAMAYTQSREWVKELIGIVQLQQQLVNEEKDETQAEDGV